jgi:hypothetical protein
MITKDRRTYAIRFLHRKKSLRDHGDALGRLLLAGVTATSP